MQTCPKRVYAEVVRRVEPLGNHVTLMLNIQLSVNRRLCPYASYCEVNHIRKKKSTLF